VLNQAFKVARSFQPMNPQQRAALLAKTVPYARHGRYELFKTAPSFDSTAHHPSWLGGPTPQVEKLKKSAPGSAGVFNFAAKPFINGLAAKIRPLVIQAVLEWFRLFAAGRSD
jgi:hypothetical protein